MKKSSIRLLVRSYTFSECRVKNQQPKQLKSVEHGLAYFQLATTVLHFQIVFTCYWDYRLVSVWMLLWLRLKGKNSLEIGFYIIISIAIKYQQPSFQKYFDYTSKGKDPQDGIDEVCSIHDTCWDKLKIEKNCSYGLWQHYKWDIIDDKVIY